MAIRWIDAGRVSGFRSQSIYHGLGHSMKDDSPDTIVLSIPEDPYMCVGYFQDPTNELDLKYCKENNLPIIVFNMNKKGNLIKVLEGETEGTFISV